MSPSWRNRIFVAFGPEHISLLKLARGLKTKLLASHDEAIAPAGNHLSWQPALDRLKQLFNEPEWQNAEVHVVLSNRLVRYATMLFNPQLKDYSEQEAFARYFYTQTFGANVEQWELRIQHGKAGSPSLVSAVDLALLEGLRTACSAHKLPLHSITPYLMPVFNHYHKEIKIDPAWLVINESGYSLLALVSGGELVAINGVSHDNISELPILLDRENLAGSFAEPCKSVYVYASSGDQLSAMSASGYEFNKFEVITPVGFPSTTEGTYAMLMSGVQ